MRWKRELRGDAIITITVVDRGFAAGDTTSILLQRSHDSCTVNILISIRRNKKHNTAIVHTRCNSTNSNIIIIVFFHLHAGRSKAIYIYCLIAILIFQTLASGWIFLIGTLLSYTRSTHARVFPNSSGWAITCMGFEEPQDKHVTDRARDPLVRISDFIDVVLFVPEIKPVCCRSDRKTLE